MISTYVVQVLAIGLQSYHIREIRSLGPPTKTVGLGPKCDDKPDRLDVGCFMNCGAKPKPDWAHKCHLDASNRGPTCLISLT